MTLDVNVTLIDFPNRGKEMVIKNEDESYTVLINSRLSYDGQLKAYEHAIKHIENDDFEKSNVQSIECTAHGNPPDSEPAQKYLERIQQLQRDKRRIQRQIKREQERVQFIEENCDMFKRAEHHYLYGNDM